MAKPERQTNYPDSLTIRIHKAPDGSWIAAPPDWEHGAVVNVGGEVVFDVETANGCWAYTTPTNAFQGEPSNGRLELGQGTNDEDLPPGGNGTTIVYYVVDPGLPPQRTIDTGPYSIKSGSQMGVGGKITATRRKRRPAPKKKKASRPAKKARGGKKKAAARKKRR